MKTNFIETRIKDVQRRCNTIENRDKSLMSIKNILLNNGHKCNLNKCLSKKKITTNLKKLKKLNNNNSPILKLPFLSDRSWFEIKRTLNKYKFNIQLVMEKRNTICTTVKAIENNQCSCYICKKLPKHLNCRSRYVVYSLTCKLCTTSTANKYIGETCVWLKDRLNQHKYSINNKDNKSALSQHCNCVHKIKY